MDIKISDDTRSRCLASTTKGLRCSRSVKKDNYYCSQHHKLNSDVNVDRICCICREIAQKSDKTDCCGQFIHLFCLRQCIMTYIKPSLRTLNSNTRYTYKCPHCRQSQTSL